MANIIMLLFYTALCLFVCRSLPWTTDMITL